MKSYIYLYTYIYSYLVILLCTAEDPAEDTLQSRALTTNAIAKYAARKRREDRGSVQDEDSEGRGKGRAAVIRNRGAFRQNALPV